MTQDSSPPADAPPFSELELLPQLLRAVQEQGYEQPTPIQAQAIPPLLAGRDVLGQAQTGTGKTAAFALPLLQRLDPAEEGVQAIVLAPTRELALQVAGAVRAYGRHLGARGVQVLPVYGGQPYEVQLRALRRGVHVVIGTPGRVRDHLERGTLDLGGVRFFGLDEADEMLKMGFIEDVEWILEQAPPQRQVALFSATLPGPIRRVADKHLRDPADVRVEHHALTVPEVEQLSLRVSGRDKAEALQRFLEAEEYEAVLVFARTQRGCAEVAELLQSRGLHAECVHGAMTQPQREAVIRRLRAGRTEIVVATDVAARGLDVDHIGLVVNYDIPLDEQVYVHRIGRTARAGRSGRAITFWRPRERRLLQSIERYTGQPMRRTRVPNRAEVLQRQRERFGEKLCNLARRGQPEFRELLETIAAEEKLELAELAAAAASLAWGEGPLSVRPEPEPQPGAAGEDEETELVIPVGKLNRVRPGDIVGAIAGEAKLPGRVVGNIRVLERVTFVAVAAEHAQTILDALAGKSIRGRVVHPRLAHPDGAPPPRRGGGPPPPRSGGKGRGPRGREGKGKGRFGKGYDGKAKGYGGKDKGYGGKDKGYGGKDKGYGGKDKGYGGKAKGKGYDSKGKGYDSKGKGYDSKGKGYGKGPKRNPPRDDRSGGSQDAQPPAP